MKYLLEIKEEAKIDSIEAYRFYESKSIGLGDRFLEQIDVFFGSDCKKSLSLSL